MNGQFSNVPQLCCFQVRCDFEEMIEKHCPEFELKAELAKGTDQEDKSVAVPRRKIRSDL